MTHDEDITEPLRPHVCDVQQTVQTPVILSHMGFLKITALSSVVDDTVPMILHHSHNPADNLEHS